MGIALGEGACRPASGSLIAEFFGPENRAKVYILLIYWDFQIVAYFFSIFTKKYEISLDRHSYTTSPILSVLYKF